MTSDGIACIMMRGGTSKGGYFLADDLPRDKAERDRLLLRIMGSPDPRQIDGIGGADPLTSKVAVVRKSERPGIDVDYLFLQVFVDQPLVSDSQNCGNILAGIGPFAIERGLVAPVEGETPVTIFMENTGQTTVARVRTKDGKPVYEGDAYIDGVPTPASPIYLSFSDAAGSSCGALLPTGSALTEIDGVECTLIDNGMPVVVMRAADFGLTGYETRAELEAAAEVKARVEKIRLQAGPLMNLGDVSEKSVPKMTLVAAPRNGGAIMTRSFIPHRVHASIGVFGGLSVATACLLPESPAYSLASLPAGREKMVAVEHASGQMEIVMRTDDSQPYGLGESSIVSTSRKLFEGRVFG
ncbi:4-oxalomesaconate tautomerase [Mesorhizobium sp. Root554]|uniref:4-oxalomesaconate tautomerase n=1 Tax=unclassified Mesorhizobium TaxID=325217 RepID=UPI0006F25E1B|nr:MULTISPECIES: 4-oxalomesaconate tautomerase [unclassified Mesorhizobium]KQZ13233.1 4-oxalomesaconate tautomerase [Mesorhizobium sp. Root1471]KQZ35747.1 4-oxalomesaconate tautomerase [Mesorhizobium sp. Root554]